MHATYRLEQSAEEHRGGIGEVVVVTAATGDCKAGPALRDGATGVVLRRVVPLIAVPSPLSAYAVAIRHATPADCGRELLALPLAPALSRAAPRRVATFLAGRYCARAALRAAGAGGAAGEEVAMRPDGAPRWPAGFVGSITHTDSLALAVVAPRASHAGIGVDCERLLTDAEGAEYAPTVLPELADVRLPGATGRMGSGALVGLAFSAKESFYKCVAPLAGVFFEFHDAILEQVDQERGTFRVCLARDLAPGFDRGLRLTGRYATDGSIVSTLVELPAR